MKAGIIRKLRSNEARRLKGIVIGVLADARFL